VFLVDDVDGFYLRHEHDLLCGFVAPD
jgi:hypothetical protein